MRTRTLLVAAAAAALTLSACDKARMGGDKPAADTAAVEAALRANEAQWNADYKAKDLAKIEAHYAPDATLMAPGEPTATGSQAIHAALGQMLADPAVSLVFQADKVGVSGDYGYTRGHFTITQTDPATKQPKTMTGAYVTLYRKQADGTWKAIEDIATPGAPGH